jgi:hypothetical protein
LLAGAEVAETVFVFGAAGVGFGAAGAGLGAGSGAAEPAGSSDSCAADDGFALTLPPCATDPASALPAAGADLAAAAGARGALAGF